MKISKSKYNLLLKNIGVSIKSTRQNAAKAVNTELVKVNWEIGRHLVKFEQQGEERAEYGVSLLASISRDLQKLHGQGFGRRNLLNTQLEGYQTKFLYQNISFIYRIKNYLKEKCVKF